MAESQGKVLKDKVKNKSKVNSHKDQPLLVDRDEIIPAQKNEKIVTSHKDHKEPSDKDDSAHDNVWKDRLRSRR